MKKKNIKFIIGAIVIIILSIFFLNKIIYKTMIYTENEMRSFKEKSGITDVLATRMYFGDVDTEALKEINGKNDGTFTPAINSSSLIQRHNKKTILYVPYMTGNQAVGEPKVIFVKVKNNTAYLYVIKPFEGTMTTIDSWIIEMVTLKEVNDVVVVNLFK